jgi:hypothetical protein
VSSIVAKLKSGFVIIEINQSSVIEEWVETRCLPEYGVKLLIPGLEGSVASLLFADDVAILAKSEEQLGRVLHIIDEWASVTEWRHAQHADTVGFWRVAIFHVTVSRGVNWVARARCSGIWTVKWAIKFNLIDTEAVRGKGVYGRPRGRPRGGAHLPVVQ